MKLLLLVSLALVANLNAAPITQTLSQRAQHVIDRAQAEIECHHSANRHGVTSMLIYLVGELKHLEREFHAIHHDLDSTTLHTFEERLLQLTNKVDEETTKLAHCKDKARKDGSDKESIAGINQALIDQAQNVIKKAQAEVAFHHSANRHAESNMLNYLVGELQHLKKEFLVLLNQELDKHTVLSYEQRLLHLTNKVDEEVAKLARFRHNDEKEKEKVPKPKITQALIDQANQVIKKAQAEVALHHSANRHAESNMLNYLVGELQHLEKEFLVLLDQELDSKIVHEYEERLLHLTNKVEEETEKLAHYKQNGGIKKVEKVIENELEKVKDEIVKEETKAIEKIEKNVNEVVHKENEKIKEEVVEEDHKHNEKLEEKIIEEVKNDQEHLEEKVTKKEHKENEKLEEEIIEQDHKDNEKLEENILEKEEEANKKLEEEIIENKDQGEERIEEIIKEHENKEKEIIEEVIHEHEGKEKEHVHEIVEEHDEKEQEEVKEAIDEIENKKVDKIEDIIEEQEKEEKEKFEEIVEEHGQKEQDKVEEVIEEHHQKKEHKLNTIIASLKGELEKAIHELEFKEHQKKEIDNQEKKDHEHKEHNDLEVAIRELEKEIHENKEHDHEHHHQVENHEHEQKELLHELPALQSVH